MQKKSNTKQSKDVSPSPRGLGAQAWVGHLTTSLREDQWNLDWTARGTAPLARGLVEARIISRSGGVWAGAGLFEALETIKNEWGFVVEASGLKTDGTLLKPDDEVVRLKGDAYSILVLERSLLNLASFVSGIATATHRLVAQVQKAAREQNLVGDRIPRVTATRKTLPGYRDLSLHGVMMGGGYSHRVNLAGGVLLKENHIECAGSDIARAVAGARAVAPHGLLIEVEVRNQAELVAACAAGAEAVMLDNYSPRETRAALAWLAKNYSTVKVEISGGLTEATIAEYVLPGVHILSSGALTHSVKAMDLSMLFAVKGR